MTDDLDRQLRRLIAGSSPRLEDDAFVEKVRVRVLRRRRAHAASRVATVLALALTAATALPYVLDGVGSVAGLVGRASSLLPAPAHWIVLGLVAAWVLILGTGLADVVSAFRRTAGKSG